MIIAKDIMTREPITVTPDTEIVQAAELLIEHGVNGLPVVDSTGGLKGIITQSDLVSQQKKLNIPSVFTLLDGIIPLSSTQAMEKELQKITATTVGEAMTPDPVTVAPDTPLEELASLIVDEKRRSLPVLSGGLLVGIVGKIDVIRTLVEHAK